MTTRVLVALGAVLVLLGIACGAVGAALWPPTYAARTEILYPITQEQPTGFLRDDRNLTTQVVLLTSRTVLGPVAAQMRLPAEDVERAVTVDLVPGSEVLRIEARDRSPELALAMVTAVLDQYMTVERAAAPSDATTYLQGQLDGVRAALGQRPITGAAAATDPQTQAMLAREQQLLTQLDETTVVDISGPRAQVLAAPYPVDRAVAPRVDLAAAAGALVGALAAAVAIGVLLRRRPS